jgi:hypothetical protein
LSKLASMASQTNIEFVAIYLIEALWANPSMMRLIWVLTLQCGVQPLNC